MIGYNQGMTSETIRELLRKQPFEPFEIRLSNGDVHAVRHPESAIVLKTNVIVGYPETDRFAVCSLLHIASIEAAHA